MSIHLSDVLVDGLPQEPELLSGVSVRLIEESERSRVDELLAAEHYLKNPKVVGQALRYVAEYRGQWLALTSLPDFERQVCRQPGPMIRRFLSVPPDQ